MKLGKKVIASLDNRIALHYIGQIKKNTKEEIRLDDPDKIWYSLVRNTRWSLCLHSVLKGEPSAWQKSYSSNT